MGVFVADVELTSKRRTLDGNVFKISLYVRKMPLLSHEKYL